jgi:hypothetical protein
MDCSDALDEEDPKDAGRSHRSRDAGIGDVVGRDINDDSQLSRDAPVDISNIGGDIIWRHMIQRMVSALL